MGLFKTLRRALIPNEFSEATQGIQTFVRKATPNELKSAVDKMERETRHFIQSAAREFQDITGLKRKVEEFKVDFAAARQEREAKEAAESSAPPKELGTRVAIQSEALRTLNQYKDMAEPYAIAKASIEAALAKKDWESFLAGIDTVKALESPRHTKELVMFLVENAIGSLAVAPKVEEETPVLLITGPLTLEEAQAEDEAQTQALIAEFQDLDGVSELIKEAKDIKEKCEAQILPSDLKDLEKAENLTKARLQLSECKEIEKTTMLIEALLAEVDGFIAEEKLDEANTFFPLIQDLHNLITDNLVTA